MEQNLSLIFAKGKGYTNPTYSILSRLVLFSLGELKPPLGLIIPS